MEHLLSTIAAVVAATGAALAAIFAGLAWLTSADTLRTSYRPLVRVLPTFRDRGDMERKRILLKNVGFGPALSVMMFDLTETEPLARIEAIQVLGDAPREVDRPGRRLMDLRYALEQQRSYRLVYQDIAGHWHETRIKVQHVDFVVNMLGQYRWWHWFNVDRRIPSYAKTTGNVVGESSNETE